MMETAPGVGEFVPVIFATPPPSTAAKSVPSWPNAIPSTAIEAYTVTVPGPLAKFEMR